MSEDALSEAGQGRALALAGVAAVALGTADWLVPATVHVTLLQLLPVLAVAWFGGTAPALVLAGLTLAAGLASDLQALPGSLPAWVPFVNAGLLAVAATALTFGTQALRHLLDSARHDYVTGVANGRAFYDLAEVELRRSRRYERPLTVAQFHIEGFQAVSDRVGHYVGDALLRSVAQALRAGARSTDLVARLEANVFAVLLPETGGEPARTGVRRIHALLESARERTRWPVTVAVGAVTFESAPETVESLLHAAGDALAAARREGRGGLVHTAPGVPEPRAAS